MCTIGSQIQVGHAKGKFQNTNYSHHLPNSSIPNDTHQMRKQANFRLLPLLVRIIRLNRITILIRIICILNLLLSASVMPAVLVTMTVVVLADRVAAVVLAAVPVWCGLGGAGR